MSSTTVKAVTIKYSTDDHASPFKLAMGYLDQ